MNIPLQPPGSILQQIYFRERLKLLNPGTFIEVGCGQGILSKLLLDLGWHGVGFDLNELAIEKALQLNEKSIIQGKYAVYCDNWLETKYQKSADLILSCMVLEHLSEEDEERYFQKCQRLLNPGGLVILFVPGAPKYWGIEDEIAGHYRRYSLGGIAEKLDHLNYSIRHMAGLTYPVSNFLYPLSEFLVARAESKKKRIDMAERTKQSGYRNVFLKTSFPPVLKIILNGFFMYPFHIWQKLNIRNENALVVYVETLPQR